MNPSVQKAHTRSRFTAEQKRTGMAGEEAGRDRSGILSFFPFRGGNGFCFHHGSLEPCLAATGVETDKRILSAARFDPASRRPAYFNNLDTEHKYPTT
ncbi:hypothetical protein GWI33_001980 [Rhynchophorus ferrugineus]|uniref:Uncharacterized protein n=1 Tax=Rhynchophorus ferrugineus TaxID=354439 RepID=A0A834IN31_RHYFE|nr:hypothetical protein GWI33_001980 [Rhynchophorus ferrugineus]